MLKIIETLEKYTLYIVIAVFGVFVLTNSTSPVVLSKLELVVVGITIMTIFWVLKVLLRRSASFSIGKFDVGVLLVTIAYLLSTILRTPNKMEAFLIPGVTTFVAASGIFYFIVNQFDKKVKNGVGIAFFASGLLLSLSILLTELKLFSKIPQLPAFIKDPLFNPIGGSIPAIIYLVPTLVIGGVILLKEKDLVRKVFWGVAGAVVVMALVILVSNSLPGKTQAPKFPSLENSWEVSVETLKKSPIFGIGAGNYLTAFNEYRPVSYNQSDLWPVRFTTASNYYLTLVTETGIIGLIALVVLLFSLYKASTKGFDLEKVSLLSLLILFAIFPASPVLLFPLFILLSLVSKSEEKVVSLGLTPALLGSAIALLGILVFDFYGVKAVMAEDSFRKALNALNQNDAKSTFNFMNAAIKQNPKVDRYHAALAQIDMALAGSLASKKDITDADKNTVTQLVQQAINEGKATVTLNPQRSGNWEVLAQIYRSIMPFAQGADNFAIQTYTQAVALDPINPSLRISLGGVYYALGRYDDAIDAFKLAILAKSDLANAHYNLAIAYREKKDYDNAIKEMNAVLTLVKKDSDDYKLAQTELTNLQSKKAAAAGTSENLTAPQKAGTSTIKPPIQLPADSTPPTQ